VLPAPVRSIGRPLLHKWRYFCGVSREKLREKLAAPGVTSCLMGGCANQIFQYSTGLALARRLGVDLKLDVSAYEQQNPAETPRIACEDEGLKFKSAVVRDSFWGIHALEQIE